MEIENLKPFDGQHCETTATGTLLRQLGIELSEPMLFGLGEGLGFIFWNMKSMNFPFIGGRIKTDYLTQNIAKNLKIHLSRNVDYFPWIIIKIIILIAISYHIAYFF